jgi:DNA-binding NtrC family response regulator
VLSSGACVGVAELMAALRDRQQRPPSAQALRPILSAQPSVPSEPLRSMERRTILETWESSGKNLSAAARALGLPRTTLRDKLRKYGLR